MQILVELILIGLATWQTVEVLHHSQLFYSIRKDAAAAAETRGAAAFFGKLYSCPFCLSHWVAGGYALIWVLSEGADAVYWWLLTLAATRAAQLGNDVFYPINRLVRYEPQPGDEDDSPAETEDQTGPSA